MLKSNKPIKRNYINKNKTKQPDEKVIVPSIKTRPTKNENTLNIAVMILGLTIPSLSSIVITGPLTNFDYSAFAVSIMFTILGLVLALKSRSMLFFTISVGFPMIYILIYQTVGNIQGYL